MTVSAQFVRTTLKHVRTLSTPVKLLKILLILALKRLASAFGIPDLGEESPLTSLLSQPLCDRLRVKPYTSADAERRNPACLSLLKNRDSRNRQHAGEFVCCQSTADSLDSVRQ